MKTIKVSSIQPGPQMDALVARARGWKLLKGEYERFGQFVCGDSFMEWEEDYNPSGNSGQCFELLEEFGTKIDMALKFWFGTHAEDFFRLNDKKAWICRAVIAAHFGDEVEVDE